jgi:hypothetical protein
MRHGNDARGRLRDTILVALVCCVALVRCTEDSGSIDSATVDGAVTLTAQNAVALAGLTFGFPDAAVFGFPGQTAALTLGQDGSSFTLTTSTGTVIEGVITFGAGTMTFGACRFTQRPAPPGDGTTPLAVEYATCEVTGQSSGDIGFGGSGDGTITLRLGRANETIVASNPTQVTYHIDLSGRITINTNTTPIGVVG